MENLTKPGNGFYITLGKLLLNFNFAKSWSWGENVGDKRNTYWLSIYSIKKDNKTISSLIIGPFKLTVGVICGKENLY
jgi:hypothetical protein